MERANNYQAVEKAKQLESQSQSRVNHYQAVENNERRAEQNVITAELDYFDYNKLPEGSSEKRELKEVMGEPKRAVLLLP